MENKEVLEFYKVKIPEVEVDFSKSIYGEMNINLNYNKTLSEERIILEKKSTPYSNNIIILYIDSVSRVNSLRQYFLSNLCHIKEPPKKNTLMLNFIAFNFLNINHLYFIPRIITLYYFMVDLEIVV